MGGRAPRRATHRQTRRRTAPQRRAPARHRLDRPASLLASYFVWPSPGKRARLASQVAGSFLPLHAGTIGRGTPTDPWLVSCSIRRRRWHVQSSPVAAPAHEMASVRSVGGQLLCQQCSLQITRLQKRTTTRLPDEFTFLHDCIVGVFLSRPAGTDAGLAIVVALVDLQRKRTNNNHQIARRRRRWQ